MHSTSEEVPELGPDDEKLFVASIRTCSTRHSDYLAELDISTLFGGMAIRQDRQTYFGSLLEWVPEVNLATYIQLFFLSSVHPIDYFDKVVQQALRNRDPSSASESWVISKTLSAVNSHPPTIDWNALMEEAKIKFPAGSITKPELLLLQPRQLQAVDMLGLVGTKGRRLTISNQNGIIPFIVWAHSLLSLTVTVKHPDRVIRFGGDEDQIIISWNTDLETFAQPELRLLDSNGNELRCLSDEKCDGFGCTQTSQWGKIELVEVKYALERIMTIRWPTR
jgi:hypothetical protein